MGFARVVVQCGCACEGSWTYVLLFAGGVDEGDVLDEIDADCFLECWDPLADVGEDVFADCFESFVEAGGDRSEEGFFTPAVLDVVLAVIFGGSTCTGQSLLDDFVV